MTSAPPFILDSSKVVIPQLLDAIRELDDRGLLHSSKWLCQLLETLPSDGDVAIQDPQIDISAENTRYVLAKSYFDLKEYRRASHALNSCISRKSQFLRLYSLFLAGEKRKQEDVIIEQKRPHEHVVNLDLAAIRDELSSAYSAGQLDGFGMYLYGIIMRECWDPTFGARTTFELQVRPIGTSQLSPTFPTPFSLFIQSVNMWQWNWSAWLELAETIHDTEALNSAIQATKNCILKDFWRVFVFHRLGMPKEALAHIAPIKQSLPSFSWLLRIEACCSAQIERYDAFLSNLEKLRLHDPHGMEFLDHMAAVLKDLGQMDELCMLAMEASSTSKWTYESCSVIARFHQMQGAMEMAHTMFTKAIELNPTVVEPWIGLSEVVGSSEERIDKFRMAEAIAPFNPNVKARIGAYYIQWSMLYAYYCLYHASKHHELPKTPVWKILTDYFNQTNMRPLARLLQDNLAQNASDSARKALFQYLQQASIGQQNSAEPSIDIETPQPHPLGQMKSPLSPMRSGRPSMEPSPSLLSPTARLFPPSPFSPTRVRPSQRSSAASMSFEYSDEGQEMAMDELGVETDEGIVIEPGARDVLLPDARTHASTSQEARQLRQAQQELQFLQQQQRLQQETREQQAQQARQAEPVPPAPPPPADEGDMSIDED